VNSRDIRICFFGDSFLAGVGDPACLGWVGRLAGRLHGEGRPLTVYNLGVRGNTSTDVLARFDVETVPRLRPGTDTRVVVSVGVNDTMLEGHAPRVTAEVSTANLEEIIAKARHHDLPLLVVGPPPIADGRHNARIADLVDRYGDLCSRCTVPFVDAYAPLIDSPWMIEARRGDGAHPAEAGYQALADLAYKPCAAWLSSNPLDRRGGREAR
jgi:acyl-CoA thioesterase I